MSVQSTVQVTAVPTATAAETTVATSAPVNVNNPGGQGQLVYGTVAVTAGTGTTAIQVKVRQGVGTGGAQIGATIPHTLAAGASAGISFSALDPVTAAAGQQYTVTVSQTGGTVAGTVNLATITVEPQNQAT